MAFESAMALVCDVKEAAGLDPRWFAFSLRARCAETVRGRGDLGRIFVTDVDTGAIFEEFVQDTDDGATMLGQTINAYLTLRYSFQLPTHHNRIIGIWLRAYATVPGNLSVLFERDDGSQESMSLPKPVTDKLSILRFEPEEGFAFTGPFHVSPIWAGQLGKLHIEGIETAYEDGDHR